jgi:uridine kinase
MRGVWRKLPYWFILYLFTFALKRSDMSDICYVAYDREDYKEYNIKPGTTLSGIGKELFPDAVCALVDGVLVSLADELKAGARINFLSPKTNQQASRVFIRGATFLLYCAARTLMPQRELMVDYALYGGIFCRIPDITKNEIASLEKKIYEYIESDRDFTLTVMQVSEAKKIMLDEGLAAKAALLAYRPFDYYRMYGFDGQQNYFHGIMPKSSGYLRGMHLKAYSDGFILTYPTPYIKASTPITNQPKYSHVFEEAERRAQVLGASYVADINDMFRNGGFADFIDVNEALHEKTIAGIAQKIADREGARVVLIAGPSSSGKTTFAGRLAVHLRAIGEKCRPISVDDYYKNREDIPCDSTGKRDYETIKALDVEKLNEDLEKLLACEVAQMPRYDFYSGERKQETVPLCVDNDILIIEGIHGLNDALTESIPAEMKFKIFVSPLTALNIDEHNVVFPDDLRLIRRLARDKRTRGFSFEQTFSVWDSVRRGEYKYILPYQETADEMFNSTLLYEPLVLKKHCYSELLKFKPDMRYYPEAHSLLKFLNYVLSFDDESAIPVKSILREFIGPLKTS